MTPATESFSLALIKRIQGKRREIHIQKTKEGSEPLTLRCDRKGALHQLRIIGGVPKIDS